MTYPPFDISPEDFEALPDSRYYVKWPDGSGENTWAKRLPNGDLILNNNPLFPRYRYMDKVDAGTGEILGRHFAYRLLHVYEAAEEDEEDMGLRQSIHEAAKAAGADLSFFSKGWGWVLVPHDGDLKVVLEALLDSGLCTQLEMHRYDPDTDRESTTPLATYLEQS